MKKIFLLTFLSVPFFGVQATDDLTAAFKSTPSYLQLLTKNIGCTPALSKILVDKNVKENKGVETYLFIATNSNCSGSFRYEFMRTASLIEKSWSNGEIVIRERPSDIADHLERAIVSGDE